MLSSGTTAISTNSAAVGTLLANAASLAFNFMTIINEGGVAGFFSFDQVNWARFAATGPTVWRGRCKGPVYIKRDGSTDITGLYAFADWLDAG